MVMIVLLVVGLTTALVSSLSYSTLKATRQENSSASLALAKEALISYAVADTNRPGELPCPDQDGDGNSNSAPPLCSTFVGYLPWKTLGIPELRDGSGTKLWYALSSNFYAGNSVILNSDTQGQFAVSGNTNINNVAAIVIAPGSPLCNHTHSTNNIGDYLESISNVNATTAVDASPSNDCNNTPYNDQLLAITASQILQPVEKRIAREAKACLDSYAAMPSSGGKYPWAAEVKNISQRPSKSGQYFGRFPDGIDASLINSNTQDFIDALNDLQAKLDIYAAAEAAGTLTNSIRTNLSNAGETLKDLNDPRPSQIFSNTGNKAEDAGKKAKKLAKTPPEATVINVQTLIDATQGLLETNLIAFASDSNFDDCLLLRANGSAPTAPAPYWSTWKNMLFYQVATGSTSAPGTCSPCLRIQDASDSNRAVVIVAGKKISANRNAATTSDYLEAANLLPKTDATKPYVTYRPTDTGYQLNNDVLACLDGKMKCK